MPFQWNGPFGSNTMRGWDAPSRNFRSYFARIDRQVIQFILFSLLVFAGDRPRTPQSDGGLRHRALADVVVEALEERWLIAIGENHGHRELYRELEKTLRDPRVQERVNDIVVEFGNALYQEVLDRYVSGNDINLEEVRPVWRNTIVSPSAVWDSPVYEKFFISIRAINRELAPEKRYRILAGDPPVDWSLVTVREDLQPHFRRSQHFVDVVRTEVIHRGRRAILLAGGAHLTRCNMIRRNKHGIPVAEVSMVSRLALHYPGAPYVIRSLGRFESINHARMAAVPAGQVISLPGTWLAELPANQVSRMRNFDGTPFVLYGDATLGTMADAIIYWGSPEENTFPEPPHSIYLDDQWWAELNRRSQIARGQPLDPALRSR